MSDLAGRPRVQPGGDAALVTARAGLVLAPNPSPMTLEGTNTWILREPGSAVAVVVDPGPADPGHLAAVRAGVAALPARIGLILLTHGHPDHADGAAALAAASGAPVRARGGVAGATRLADGETLAVGGLEVAVVAAPGHTADSVCFLLPADGALLTGDTVLGRGSSVVAHPDGRLADYLDTLHRLRELVDTAAVRLLLPGHGPVRTDPAAALDAYLSHRAERLAAVREALAAGATTPDEVVRLVYADVDERLRPAAERSVRAQLDYLRGPGDG